MVDKPDRDVTRMAVERAVPVLTKAKDLLKTIIYTGPDQILMSNKEILHGAADGNPDMLKHVGNTASDVDNQLLEKLLMTGQLTDA
jgi:hypothetical protein